VTVPVSKCIVRDLNWTRPPLDNEPVTSSLPRGRGRVAPTRGRGAAPSSGIRRPSPLFTAGSSTTTATSSSPVLRATAPARRAPPPTPVSTHRSKSKRPRDDENEDSGSGDGTIEKAPSSARSRRGGVGGRGSGIRRGTTAAGKLFMQRADLHLPDRVSRLPAVNGSSSFQSGGTAAFISTGASSRLKGQVRASRTALS
jgi:hypothetical protein